MGRAEASPTQVIPIAVHIIGASLSEPHIDETNARNPYIMFIGASLSEPHIDETNARNPYIIMFIIIIIYVRSA